MFQRIKATVEISIDLNDISEMDYWLQCPMSYPSKNNSIAIALKRVLHPECHDVHVVLQDGEAMAVVNRQRFSLGRELGLWLEQALSGWDPLPIKKVVEVPTHLVMSDHGPNKRRKKPVLTGRPKLGVLA